MTGRSCHYDMCVCVEGGGVGGGKRGHYSSKEINRGSIFYRLSSQFI